MIFVILGTQKFQFNRLLKELDVLVENGSLREEGRYRPAEEGRGADGYLGGLFFLLLHSVSGSVRYERA